MGKGMLAPQGKGGPQKPQYGIKCVKPLRGGRGHPAQKLQNGIKCVVFDFLLLNALKIRRFFLVFLVILIFHFAIFHFGQNDYNKNASF